MRVIKGKDYKDMSRKAANIISAEIITKPDCVLGLATGSSPIGIQQRKFREAGNPWELCKGFDSSAAIGTFVPVDRYKDIQSLNFNLMIDGKEVQRGCTADMLFKVDDIIAYVSKFVTLKIGDLLFTGTPAGVGPVSIGQHLQGYLEGEKLLDFYIR